MFPNNLTKFFRLSLFFAIAFLTFPSVFPQTQNKTIELLDIQGNRRWTDDEILTHIKTRALQTFNEKQLQNDLQKLLALGWFDPAHTKVFTEPGNKDGVNVIIEVLELPIVEEVNFEGLEYFTKAEIMTALTQEELNIEKGDIYNAAKLIKAVSFLKNFFVERGFHTAKISVWEEEVSVLSLKIGFYIEEQPEN